MEESSCEFALKAASLSKMDVSDLANHLKLIVHQPPFTAGFFGSGWMERPDHHSWDSGHFAQTGSKTNLTKDSLASQQLGAKANDKAQHCQTTIPCFSNVAEAESRLS